MNETARDLLWNITLAGLALCVALVLWLPILRIESIASVNLSYNEGWNVYRQAEAAAGVPLYAAPPGLFSTNYPPISFHFVGLFGNPLVAGRVIALVGLLAVGGLVCMVVRVSGAPVRAGVFAGLCLVLWICTFSPNRRAMDDPEFLGTALAVLGVLAFVRARASWGWLAWSGVAFALAMFTKQDLVAFPISIGVKLLLDRNYHALAVWGAAGLGCAVLLLAFSEHFDGPYFLADILQNRSYLLPMMAKDSFNFGRHFSILLFFCAGYLVWTRRFGLWGIMLFVSLVISVYFSGGDGVDNNIFYPPLMTMAIISGLAASAGTTSMPMLAMVLAVPALSGVLFVPRHVQLDVVELRQLPGVAAATQRAITLVRAANGAAICEDILICYDAGKKLDYDSYYVNDQVETGRLKEADIVRLLASKHYAVIELDPTVESAGLRHLRFSQAELRAIASAYARVFSAGEIQVWEPRQ